MPESTMKPCKYPGCANLVRHGYCEKHSDTKRIRPSKSKRDLDTQKLYNPTWERRREYWLSNYPWCEECLDHGLYVPATDVHHVIRHRGDANIFITSPLQSLCHSCHTRHTNYEKRMREPYYPAILEPLSIPLHMVCGPPGSGKNTYVSARVSIEDLIIDLDQILANMTGRSIYYPHEMKVIEHGWQLRNNILTSLILPCEYHAAWFIVSAGRPSDRRIWKTLLHPESVTILLTDEAECIRRIRQDPRRAYETTKQIEAVHRWYGYYQEQEDETIIKFPE